MSDRDARHGEGLASGHRYERRTVAYIGRAAGLSRWHCGSGPRPAPRLRRADKGVVLRFLGRVRGDICPGWLPSIGTLGRSSRASGPAVAASPASIAPRTWHYWPRPTAWGGGAPHVTLSGSTTKVWLIRAATTFCNARYARLSHFGVSPVQPARQRTLSQATPGLTLHATRAGGYRYL